MKKLLAIVLGVGFMAIAVEAGGKKPTPKCPRGLHYDPVADGCVSDVLV